MYERRTIMKFTKAFQLLVVASLLLTARGSPPRTFSAAKAQPQLAQMATEQPDALVRVIVQKIGAASGAEQAVAQLGGQVTQDLSIINAFAAEMPAQAVLELSQSDSVRWVSLDAPMLDTAAPCSSCINTSALMGAYTKAIGADRLWNAAPYLQGQGITVAVVDSGIANHADLALLGSPGQNSMRIQASAKFNSFTNSSNDGYGHGTHVAGIIAGNGARSKGAQIGVAPKVNIVNVKVSDDRGASTASDVVAGLQWVYENKARYNIRVVNLSLNSSVVESYHTSPIDAAVEVLWFNGIVVVVSAGNNGENTTNDQLFPPANDPFVITVGAANDMGTPSVTDDVLNTYSACGVTESGFAKPELIAPGTNLISLLASTSAELAKGHPEHRVDGFAGGRDYYFRMSGTSMSAPVVSGAIALLLQDEPNLNPDQVKHRLVATGTDSWKGYHPQVNCGKYLDIYAAVRGTTTATANTGIPASLLLTTGSEPITWNSVGWNSVGWNSVGWNSVGWNSVGWNSVGWNSVGWNTDHWDK
jgi:serine protease AprX